MASNPKIRSAVEIAASRGIGLLDAAPPLHRLLWAMGVQARPPHFASFGANALLFGGFWGVWMEAFVVCFAFHRHPGVAIGALAGPIAITALLSAVFGCVLAFVFRSRARALALPDWDALLG